VTALSEEVRRELAERLRRSESECSPIEPLTRTHPAIDLEDAYEIQLVNVQARLKAGAVVRGHKVGLTSGAMQEMLGVGEPDYGHLLDAMFVEGEMNLQLLIAPRIEPEIAFVLATDLEGPGCTPEEVREATDYVVPALEIIDSRIQDWHIGLADTVADNASSAAVALGTRRTRLDCLDLPTLNVRLIQNGVSVEAGRGDAVLGDPAVAVAWLVNRLASHGVALRGGHIVLSGSCTRAIPIESGDHISAEVDVLGDVSVAFS
jgi:2-keto-4-pentenoate hydratase